MNDSAPLQIGRSSVSSRVRQLSSLDSQSERIASSRHEHGEAAVVVQRLEAETLVVEGDGRRDVACG